MDLFLLRHGLAMEREEFHGADDGLRPLTTKGQRQLLQVAAAMRSMGLRFDTVLSSPLVRARQTAEIVAAELKLKKRLSFADELKPGIPPSRLLRKITRLGPVENLLLVGHEPDLSGLVSLLVTGAASAGFALKKGGLARLEVETLRAGQCAVLAWLLTPKQMEAMG